MHAHEHVLAIGNVALDEGNVMLAVEIVDEAISGEISVLRRHFHTGSLPNKIFVGLAIVLQILDGDKAEAPFLRQLAKLGGAHHGAVFAHNLAAEADFLQARQAAEIDGGFGVAIALEHAVFLREQREHMPRATKILRLCFLVHTGACGDAAFFGRNTGGRGNVVDGNGERCFVVVGVGGDHLRQAEPLDVLGAHRHADQALGVGRHKIHVLGGRKFCSTDEIAFVFAIGIVGDENELAGAQIRQRFFDGIKGCHNESSLKAVFG